MNWRNLVTARPGYSIQSHNRWFSSWVAFRANASRNSANFRIIRIASKRVVFEVEGARDKSGRQRFRIAFALASLVALLGATTLFLWSFAVIPETSNVVETEEPINLLACDDLQSLSSFEAVDNTAMFDVQGWRLEIRSDVISLGQLASANYFATCNGQTRDIRVVFIRQGEKWHIEKMAPTK